MSKFKMIMISILDTLKLIFYQVYFKFKKENKNETWLISERGIEARDNGYIFYKYLKEKHPEISVKYVIDKRNSDISKIDFEDAIQYKSKEHYYYFLYSKYLISAEIMGFSPNEQLYYRLNRLGLLKTNGKKVFLQHGITMGNNSYLLPQKTKLDLLICGAIPEHQHMIEYYKYPAKIAKLTGFARFDKLITDDKKIVLIMMTWRKWLKYKKSLNQSTYYKRIRDLIEDPGLNEIIYKKNYKVILYPHFVLQKHIKEFKKLEKENIIIADQNDFDIQELLKEAKILITDYSSIHFDFAYMKKNIIYYQFDEEEYYNKHCPKGYYNYYKDGFGPVCHNKKEVVKELTKFINNPNYNKKYLERIKMFFKYFDQNNCERIFRAIKKTEE